MRDKEEVEAFIINNQSQIIAVNKPGCRGYVQIGYLEDEKKFIVIFIPLEVLLSSEHQEAIATNGNFVQHLLNGLARVPRLNGTKWSSLGRDSGRTTERCEVRQ